MSDMYTKMQRKVVKEQLIVHPIRRKVPLILGCDWENEGRVALRLFLDEQRFSWDGVLKGLHDAH